MSDVWSNDPDRTTRNNDTRTPEQVTADTFPQYAVTETIHHGNYRHTSTHTGATVQDALTLALMASPYYGDLDGLYLSREMVHEIRTTGHTEFGWATYTLA